MRSAIDKEIGRKQVTKHMGNQFKKPFPNPEKRAGNVSPSSSIPEQDTIESRAVNSPTAPNMPPQQGYVQGRHGQYGARSTGQLFSGPGQPGSFPQQGGPTLNSPFGNQAGNMPLNPPFAAPRTPPMGNAPLSSSGAPGDSTGSPVSMFGMGSPVYTPNPAWSNRRPLTSEMKKDLVSPGKSKKRKKKRKVPIWARVVIGFLTFMLLLAGGGFWYYQTNYASVVGSVTSQQFTRKSGDGDPNVGKPSNILDWKQRANILLLGSDTDEKPVWGGSSFLAQTVIVVSIDPTTHEVDMLSIPRDYWINIPGYGMDKLDTAFSHGGSINNNMSGVGEVSLTLKQDFGIEINYYAWVGLNGFISVIDTVGGVDVNVTHPVVDDTYPDDVGTHGSSQSNYKRVYIPDGPQHLDGPTALEYVRSRHSTTDFDRSTRQQQVLSALKLKLDNAGIIGQLPSIANDLKGSVKTSLSPTQAIELVNFARGVDQSKIHRLTLGGSKYTSSINVTTASGAKENALQPKCDAVIDSINSFLHMNSAVCNIAASSNNGYQSPLVSVPGGSTTGSLASTAASTSSLAEADTASWQEDLGNFSFSNLFGMRPIIDLMSLVVLDSPRA